MHILRFCIEALIKKKFCKVVKSYIDKGKGKVVPVHAIKA